MWFKKISQISSEFLIEQAVNLLASGAVVSQNILQQLQSAGPEICDYIQAKLASLSLNASDISGGKNVRALRTLSGMLCNLGDQNNQTNNNIPTDANGNPSPAPFLGKQESPTDSSALEMKG